MGSKSISNDHPGYGIIDISARPRSAAVFWTRLLKRGVSVRNQAEAERFYERVLHAGGDTSRLTISVGEVA